MLYFPPRPVKSNIQRNSSFPKSLCVLLCLDVCNVKYVCNIVWCVILYCVLYISAQPGTAQHSQEHFLSKVFVCAAALKCVMYSMCVILYGV